MSDIEETDDEHQCRMESEAETRHDEDVRARGEAVDKALAFASAFDPTSAYGLLAAEVVRLRGRLQQIADAPWPSGEAAPF